MRSFGSLFSVFLIVFALPSMAQEKFEVDKGEISFTSNAQLEMIKATSKELKGIIDPATNQFAFRVNVRSFLGFNSSLQREHFNESYLESEKVPTASFSGKIIEKIDFASDGVYDVRAKGDLDIHGQKQTRIIKSKLTIKNGTLSIEAYFIVPLSDHNISIPRIVNQKIATEIEVSIKAIMISQS
jgi:YceI-like domain